MGGKFLLGLTPALSLVFGVKKVMQSQFHWGCFVELNLTLHCVCVCVFGENQQSMKLEEC